MLTRVRIALALALLPSTLAFRNTSPFFLFSSAKLPVAASSAHVAPASAIAHQVAEALAACPSQIYLLVRQDGVSSADYRDGLSTPRLAQYLSGDHEGVQSTMTVPELVGTLDHNAIAKYLETKCDAQAARMFDAELPPAFHSDDEARPRVFGFTLPAPNASAGGNRGAVLGRHDALLERAIAHLAQGADYTVIYTTTPEAVQRIEAAPTQHTYEMEDPYGEVVRMELKRDSLPHRRAKAEREGALFERYQYLSPGLFMGISASIPLFLILYFGLTSISSLEVSYLAFSKEIGLATQRK